MPAVAENIGTGRPRFFTKTAMVIVNAHGFLSWIPIGMTLMAIGFWETFYPAALNLVSILEALGLSLVLPIYFLPVGLGNPYIRRLVNAMNPSVTDGFIVQMIRSPRMRTGFWAFME